jgi:hypothetical protein
VCYRSVCSRLRYSNRVPSNIDTESLSVLSDGNVDTASGGKVYGKCHHCCKKPYLCPDLQPVCFHKEGFVVNKCNIDKKLRHGIDQYDVTVLSAL